MTPTYFGSISTITYSIGYCLGTTLSNKDNRTNNSYYQLQLDSIADKTIYVSTCYVSFDGSSQQSAPTFCHAPQPSQCKNLLLMLDLNLYVLPIQHNGLLTVTIILPLSMQQVMLFYLDFLSTCGNTASMKIKPWYIIYWHLYLFITAMKELGSSYPFVLLCYFNFE